MQAPGKGQFQAGNPIAQAAGVNVAANNPVTAALGNAANAVQGVGNLAEAMAKDRERQYLMETDLKMDKLDAELQDSLIGNTDFQSHTEIARQKYDSIKADLTADKRFSPRFQREIELRFGTDIERRIAGVGTQAKILQLENGKSLNGKLIQRAIDRGQWDEAEKYAGDIHSNGYGSKENADFAVEVVRNAKAESALAMDTRNDPKGTIEKLKDPSNYPHLNPISRINAEKQAKAEYRVTIRDSLEQFQDDLANGEIDTSEKIHNKYGGKVRPAVLEEMDGLLARRLKLISEGQRKSPEAQAQIIGEVERLTKDLAGANMEDFEKRYSTAAFTLSELVEDSPDKIRLNDKLKVAASGREAEVKTHKDAAFKALDAYDDRESAKLPKVGRITTRDLVNDGFLKDPSKIIAGGISKENADTIAELAKEKGNSVAQAKLKELWKTREAGSVNADKIVIATLEALVNDNADIAWNEPESEDAAITARIEADRRAGERRMKLSEFLTVTPDATNDQIDEKILEIGGEQTHRDLKSGIYDSTKKPDSPKGADSSTSSIPMGKDLKTIVKHFEAGGAPSGFHRTAYWDYGQWSIGYGTKAKEGEVIGQEEAEKRLDSELASHRKRVETFVAAKGMKFEPHEIDALTSFDFNTGRIEQLTANGTRSKAEIAAAMLLYRNADGQRLAGLERRRQAEQTLFLKGYTA